MGRLDGDVDRVAEYVDDTDGRRPRSARWIIRVSTQRGCAVGCSICDAGALGYGGSLRACEILGQVERVLASRPELDPAAHPRVEVRFDRMGEPTLNPAVLEALRGLRRLIPGRGLLACLSTVAPDTPMTSRFLDELAALKAERYPGGALELQFSLHGVTEAQRRRVIPIRAWSFERIAEFGRSFRRPGDRKVALSLAAHPRLSLAGQRLRLFDPQRFLLRVTPVHPTEQARRHGLAGPPRPPAALLRLARRLGLDAELVRPATRGARAGAECGQLWSPMLRREAAIRLRNEDREALAYVRGGELEAKTRSWLAEIGGAHAVERLEAPALLVVDAQEAYFSPRSARFMPEARVVGVKIAELVCAFRAGGRPVFFLLDPSTGPPGADARLASFLVGPSHEPVLRRAGADAFGGGRLERELASLGTRTVVVCGLNTHAAVAASAVQAHRREFDAVVAVDACAASEERQHLAGLRALRGRARLAPTSALLRALR